MKALITGIAGFAGNYLAQLLLEKGLDVYGASQENDFKPFLPIDGAAVHYTSINLQDRARVGGYLGDVRPDLVFHLAAKSSPAQSAKCPQETFAVNFGGTLAILEAIRLREIRCRFLLVSSSHVYGNWGSGGSGESHEPVPEDAPLKPESPYAASKAAAEMAAYQYWKTYGIEIVIARAFNHTGPGQGQGFVCPDLARKVVEIERGLRTPRLEVLGLSRRMDFSHVRDVVRGYHSALVIGTPGEAYNLCSGKGVTVQTIAENLIAGSSKTISVGSCPSESQAGGKPGIVGDNAKAARDLGWEPLIPVSETMREVISYWRQSFSTPSQPTERDGTFSGC
ncbi:MAG: GDP-mannose 4,6-dehydratase [Terriglobia bacterium]